MELKKLLNGIKSKITDLISPNRKIYAVTSGKYLGQFFVYMDKIDDNIVFLSLPDMDKVTVTTEKFNFAIENKILDPVEDVPKEIYNLCKEHYDNINT